MQAELSRYTFRRLANTELSLANDLYNRSYHSNRSIAQAEWLYKNNPYGEALIFGALDSNGQLVGMRPAIASRLFWRGQHKPAYQFIDALVAPEHRKRGIFTHLLNLMSTLAAENNFATYSLTNDDSASVYRKTPSFSFLGRCETHVKVLSWHRYLGSQLGNRLRLHGRNADVYTAPDELDPGLSDGNLCLMPISRFASDYEEVHSELGKILPSFTLRQKEFLNWRFFGSSERRYRVAEIQQSGRSQGYVVVRMIGQLAHVIDLFVIPNIWFGTKASCLFGDWATQLGAIAMYFTASEMNVFQRAFPKDIVRRRAKTSNIFLDSNSVRYLASLHGRPVDMSDFYFVMGDANFM